MDRDGPVTAAAGKGVYRRGMPDPLTSVPPGATVDGVPLVPGDRFTWPPRMTDDDVPLTTHQVGTYLRERAHLQIARRRLEADIVLRRQKAEARIQEDAAQEQYATWAEAVAPATKMPDPSKALGANAEDRARNLAMLLEQDASYTGLRDSLTPLEERLLVVNAELEVAAVERRAREATVGEGVISVLMRLLQANLSLGPDL